MEITTLLIIYILLSYLFWIGEGIYSSTAAWAAAKRAMGTRKGEQDT